MDTKTLKTLIEVLGPEAALALLAGGGSKAKGGGKAKKAKASEADRAEAAEDTNAKVVKAFRKAGYKGDIKPREAGPGGVLVYGKVKDNGDKTGWLAHGRRPRYGESSVKVMVVRANGTKGSIPLFHYDQTQTEAEWNAAKAIRDGAQPQAVAQPTDAQIAAFLAKQSADETPAAMPEKAAPDLHVVQ